MTESLPWPDQDILDELADELQAIQVPINDVLTARMAPQRQESIIAMVRDELVRDPLAEQLFIYSVRDRSGLAHVCVDSFVPPGRTELYYLPVAKMRHRIIMRLPKEIDAIECLHRYKLGSEGTEI